MTESWAGSSWERVCRAVFGGDEGRMLAWARRYLAAYPDVAAAQFHLGTEFRRIVGARPRLDWWRKAAAQLEARAGASPGDGEGRVAEAEAPTYRPLARTSGPPGSRTSRLRSFDEATERQRRRERGLPAVPLGGPPRRRGWTRDDANERRP